MDEHPFAIRLQLRDGYQFDVAFDQPGVPPLRTDETRPLGDGAGPNPTRLLAAAIGNCLGASLLFCLRKSRVDVTGLTVRVTGTLARNPRGRLRIATVRVALEPLIPAEQQAGLARCREIFEDFCLVTESVRHGLTVETTLAARTPEPASV